MQVFFSSDDWLFVHSDSFVTEKDSLPVYVHPKEKIGTYAPLMILDAPLDLNKPFEVLPDGKLIFADGFGVRIKDLPGIPLNDCYPGSDGAVYSIDFSPELKEWSLYKCRRVKAGNSFVIEAEKVGRSLTVQEMNSEPKSVSILYDKLENVNIYLTGAQAIALSLPVHCGNF